MGFLRTVIVSKFLFLFSLCAYGNASEKEQMLRVFFKLHPPAKLYLYSFYGVRSTRIDSATATITGSFDFHLKDLKKGFYRLFVNDTNYVDLILSDKESVELMVKGITLKKDTEIKKSVENKALWELKAFRLCYNNRKNEIFLSFEKYKNDPEKYTKARKSMDSLERYSNTFTYDLLNKNKGTYFSLTNKMILSPLYTDSALFLSRYKKDTLAFLRENFFNSIDFTKEELVNSTLLPNQYMKYLEKYVEYDEKGFKQAIDLILSKAVKNQMVYQLSLDFLLQLFSEAGPEIIFEYIVDRYYDKNTCNASYSEKADKFRSLALGNELPDVPLRDFQSYQSIRSIYSENKLTLIYFWSSHCSFCSESLPLLIETYKEFHSEGLEALAVSIDESKIDWEAYVKTHSLPWLNYNEYKGWDSEVVRKMMVNKTPTFFLVNSNGVIVGKNHNFVEIRGVIKALLEKK
jgi:thiol-disulfide isomerase/thioredoxin